MRQFSCEAARADSCRSTGPSLDPFTSVDPRREIGLWLSLLGDEGARYARGDSPVASFT